MSAAHEAVDAVQFLLSTGAATDLARAMGEAFARGFAAETGTVGKLADALFTMFMSGGHKHADCAPEFCARAGARAGHHPDAPALPCRFAAARAALRAAGRLP